MDVEVLGREVMQQLKQLEKDLHRPIYIPPSVRTSRNHSKKKLRRRQQLLSILF
jgi:hypothetical protein